MKKLIIAYLFTITNVLSAPPTYFNGELQTNTYIQNIKAPNYQTTPLGGIDRRLETGNLNELQNPNFEHLTVSTGWTVSNATASGSTSAIEGKKSLSLALTGALSLSQSSTINAARKSNVQMVASVWVNSSDVSDLQLCSLKNGAEDKCTVTGGYVQGSGWRQLTVSFIGNATSNGLKLKSTDTTGTVLVDQAYVGIGSPIVDFTPDNVYSATINGASGAVSGENTDWINGNCSANGSSPYQVDCALITGVFTGVPNCTISHISALNDSQVSTVRFTNLSTSQLRFTQSFNGIPSTVGDVKVICQKNGADYRSSKAYVTSSSDYGWTSFIPTSPNSSLTLSASSCYHKREGEDLLIDCRALVSSPQASEMRISLPNNLTMSNNLYSLLKQCGSYYRTEGNINATKNGALICESGFNYVRFSLYEYANANSPFVAQNANSVIANGQTLTFTARIPIQGWQDSGVIVGSFQGYNETPGTSRVETFSVSYGTTNASTVCSASPCSYLDQIGNAVTSITRASQGNYTMNMSKTYSKLKCSGTSLNSASGDAWIRGLRCENCSSLSFTSVLYNTSGAVDSFGTILCHGTP